MFFERNFEILKVHCEEWGHGHRRGGDLLQLLLHEAALPLLHPRVVLLVRGVDEGVGLLVLLDVLLHRFDALGQRPPLHLGLVVHVGDLLLEAVPVHLVVVDEHEVHETTSPDPLFLLKQT